MTPTTVLENPQSVDEAHVLVDRLAELLDNEFEALKVQDWTNLKCCWVKKTTCSASWGA